MTGDVPRGWIIAPLSQLGVWSSGGTPSRKNPDNFGGPVPWLKIGDLPDGPVLTTEESLTERGLAASSANWLPPNTLLVAMYGASIGKLGITTFRCTTNQAVAACIPHAGVDLRYLFAALALEKKRLIDKGQGGAQPNISQTILKVHEVLIAPANEQRRIVSKIDELFSRIDEGEAALARVAKLVERYRQSVLNAAVTGELTRDWRNVRKRVGEPVESGAALLARILKDRRAAWETAELAKFAAKGKPPTDDRWKQKYKEPAPPDTTDMPALPKGWVWASMDQLLVRIEAGKSFKCDERPPTQGEYGIVKVSAVTWGFYDESESKTITDPDRVERSYLIRPGDFLFSRANTIELVGACAIADTTTRRLLLSDKILRFVFVVDLKAWCDLVLKSRLGRGQIEELSTGNQESMRNIGQQRITRIAVPIPPPSEIAELIRKRDQIQLAARGVRSLAKAEQRRSAALRQSILKAAFSGLLVPQDPTDEPASKLLERIAAERAVAPAARQHKKKSA